MMFDQEIADRICDQVAEGVPLRVVCRQEGMPAWRTVYDWIEREPEFAAAMAVARKHGFDAIAEECLDIADDTSRDTKTVGRAGNESEVADAEWIGRSKLRVWTRLQLLAKWDPKRYGEKMQLGGDADNPLVVAIASADGGVL